MISNWAIFNGAIRMKYCVGILPDFINGGLILMHDYSGSHYGVDL